MRTAASTCKVMAIGPDAKIECSKIKTAIALTATSKPANEAYFKFIKGAQIEMLKLNDVKIFSE